MKISTPIPPSRRAKSLADLKTLRWRESVQVGFAAAFDRFLGQEQFQSRRHEKGGVLAAFIKEYKYPDDTWRRLSDLLHGDIRRATYTTFERFLYMGATAKLPSDVRAALKVDYYKNALTDDDGYSRLDCPLRKALDMHTDRLKAARNLLIVGVNADYFRDIRLGILGRSKSVPSPSSPRPAELPEAYQRRLTRELGPERTPEPFQFSKFTVMIPVAKQWECWVQVTGNRQYESRDACIYFWQHYLSRLRHKIKSLHGETGADPVELREYDLLTDFAYCYDMDLPDHSGVIVGSHLLWGVSPESRSTYTCEERESPSSPYQQIRAALNVLRSSSSITVQVP